MFPRLAAPAAAALVAALCAAGAGRAEQLRAPVESDPWLGVGIQLGEVGVLVTDVVDGAPAQVAGLLPGDEIVSVNRRRVIAPEVLQRLIRAKKVGQKVELRVMRDQRDFRVQVALEAMPDANEILRRRLVGKPAPQFEVEVLGGNAKGKLSDLRGKVVLVEFWVTYCTACALTHDALSELAKARARDGLVVLAISKESEAALKHYLARHSPAFSVARDTGGEASDAYYAQVLPTLVVIDRRGVVRFAGINEDPARSGLSARESIEANVAAASFAAERLLGSPSRSVGEQKPHRAPR